MSSVTSTSGLASSLRLRLLNYANRRFDMVFANYFHMNIIKKMCTVVCEKIKDKIRKINFSERIFSFALS